MERLTETRDGQWVIPLRQDGKHKWALCKAGLSCDDSTEYLYGDHANKLAAYEETGLTPEQVKALDENARTSLLTWFAEKYGFPVGELMNILEAKQEGRLKIVKKAPEGAICGNCGDFIRTEGTARGTCRTQHRKRLGSKNELRSVAQSTKACAEFYAGGGT